MKQIVRTMTPMVFLAASFVAQAATIESSTSVYLTLRECVAGESPCDSVTPQVSTIIEGLPGNTESNAAHQDPSYGKVKGGAKLTGDAGGSEHNSHTVSLPGTRNGSNTVTLQKYTNDGSIAQDLVYAGTLTYEQTVPEDNAGISKESGGQTTANAMLFAFRLDVDAIEAGTTAEDNYKILTDGPEEEAAFTDLGQDEGSSAHESGTGTIDVSISLTVKPGESVWFWAMTQALAANGGEVSSSFVTRLIPEP